MAQVPKVRLAGGLEICRILNGRCLVVMVRLISPKQVMQAYVDAGLTTFDMADIYGPAEEIFKHFNSQPAAKMEAFCLSHGIQLLTYAGGLLSERYLGKAEPTSRAELNTASLSKYKNELLVALDTVARGHGCSIANVATRYVLDRPAVGGIIVGCCLGVAGEEHIEDSLRSCSPELEVMAQDLRTIDGVVQLSRDLMSLIRDEYRN
ncbi:unnamed protein product [Coregonus sp. 'balchen']|nr:unnamed protein product [Coregonus sp. 'balchen']